MGLTHPALSPTRPSWLTVTRLVQDLGELRSAEVGEAEEARVISTCMCGNSCVVDRFKGLERHQVDLRDIK